uniref:C2H2-type domain-containing protein n=1 Tax=Anabas testudineus TaxID=64144 RepID=A0A3Q1HL01_ANATE
MGPDSASVSKTESSGGSNHFSAGPREVVVKVISESEVSTPSEPDNSKQPENNISDKCYPCPICGKVFDRPSKLERHKPVHLKKPKTLHQCQHCDKSFTQQEKLIRHQNCHNRTNKHPCPDCGKVFNRPSKLERHKRTHAKKPKVPHQCSYLCGKGFSESGHCKAHEKTHEEQPEKPHSCVDCGMCFFKASELRRHYRSHTGEKPFRCTVCERFYSRQDLNIHGLTHSGEKPHLCPVCGKGFSQLGNMKEHEQNVHIKSEQYICNECGATFTRYKSLTKHQRTHTGERPYLCLTCGRRFSWSHSLSRHRRTHTHIQLSSYLLINSDKPISCDSLTHFNITIESTQTQFISAVSPVFFFVRPLTIINI